MVVSPQLSVDCRRSTIDEWLSTSMDQRLSTPLVSAERHRDTRPRGARQRRESRSCVILLVEQVLDRQIPAGAWMHAVRRVQVELLVCRIEIVVGQQQRVA